MLEVDHNTYWSNFLDGNNVVFFCQEGYESNKRLKEIILKVCKENRSDINLLQMLVSEEDLQTQYDETRALPVETGSTFIFAKERGVSKFPSVFLFFCAGKVAELPGAFDEETFKKFVNTAFGNEKKRKRRKRKK